MFWKFYNSLSKALCSPEQKQSTLNINVLQGRDVRGDAKLYLLYIIYITTILYIAQLTP